MTSARTNAFIPFAIAAATGAALWLIGAEYTGRREAWDSGVYWAVFYPLAVAACGFLGYLFPERPSRWALALFLSQFVVMIVRSGEIGGLAPLGLMMMLVLALPGAAVAKLGAGLKRKARY